MKRRIPKDHLLAFARECLKLEQLLSEPDGLAELGKFLHLVRSMEKSGGLSVLETLLRPEHTAAAGLSIIRDSAVRRPIPSPSTQARATKEAT